MNNELTPIEKAILLTMREIISAIVMDTTTLDPSPNMSFVDRDEKLLMTGYCERDNTDIKVISTLYDDDYYFVVLGRVRDNGQDWFEYKRVNADIFDYQRVKNRHLDNLSISNN